LPFHNLSVLPVLPVIGFVGLILAQIQGWLIS
jgi:hypothetical protein